MAEAGWARVGEAIAARMQELQLTKAEVIRASGISPGTLDGYIAGQPVRRTDKKRELCRALGWTSDSIDRVLAGHEPRPLAPDHGGSEGWPAWLEDRFNQLLERVQELEKRLPPDPPPSPMAAI